MRLALFSDTHGNPIAIDAVLADIEAVGGVDGCWVLGDLVAIGHDPVGALERLTTLPKVRFVQGNTDRYTTDGDRPYPSYADAEADNQLIPRLAECANTFAWAQGAVSATGWYDFLATLPFEQRLTLPDGARMLGVHVAPDRNDGEGIGPETADDTLRTMLAGCAADLVVTGHTHLPHDRVFEGIRLVNVGSVSNPRPPDRRASWVLLTATAEGYTVEHRRVPYDLDAVIAAVERSRHPSARFVTSLFRD